MRVDLYIIKKHINVDSDYIDDDEYIEQLIFAAELAVQNHIQTKLDDLEDEEGEIPYTIKQAIIMLVAQWYANREPVSFVYAHTIPFSIDYLLQPYKNYDMTVQ